MPFARQGNREVKDMRTLTPRDIGALARDARRELGMTQTQLATKIGASRFWVAEFEQGKPRAELGLVLKALKALRLVLTVDTESTVSGQQGGISTGIGEQPLVELSAILRRTATPPSSPVEYPPRRRNTPRKRTRRR
ncbi:MAG TPA: helix-turn-helix domain-containing protein [Gemmatimonadaceae bacterium]